MKKKIFILHNGTGSRFYRLVPQLQYMQSQGHKIILSSNDDKHTEQKIDWADIIIFQMVFSLELIKYAKQKNKKVVFECDDLIHRVSKTHYSYEETKGIKNRLKWWKRIYQCFSRCDGFISTNKNLDNLYGRFAKKSLIFDNYIDLPHWLKEYKPNTTDRVRLLWAGSTSHTGDLQMIKPVIDKILNKYPQVQFIYVGTGGIRTDDLHAKFIYGDDLFRGLPNNRESMLPITAKLWPYILSTLQADIAIAPLEKNDFNKYKSQCKYLEYSINKIPSVCSKWFYTNADITADTQQEWIDKISSLIENKEERKRLGKQAYKKVLKNFDIRTHIKDWQDFLENL